MKKETVLTYYGKVEAGQISLPKKMRAEIGKVFDGHRIEVTIKRARKHRSSEQNRYYWGVLVQSVLRAFIDLGNDLQEGNAEHAEIVHEFLRDKFLENGLEVYDAEGNLYHTRPSTTRLTTVEQEEYHDRIRQFAAEYLSISIPLPNEQAELW